MRTGLGFQFNSVRFASSKKACQDAEKIERPGRRRRHLQSGQETRCMPMGPFGQHTSSYNIRAVHKKTESVVEFLQKGLSLDSL
ncbi:hypothetical protein KL944_000785 [Ogataea haglerorum]|nr:hypothetical protein KL944_000785 [Ogataea haglerorum]